MSLLNSKDREKVYKKRVYNNISVRCYIMSSQQFKRSQLRRELKAIGCSLTTPDPPPCVDDPTSGKEKSVVSLKQARRKGVLVSCKKQKMKSNYPNLLVSLDAVNQSLSGRFACSVCGGTDVSISMQKQIGVNFEVSQSAKCVLLRIKQVRF